MIWITGFPLGPSANYLYEPNVRRYRDKTGKIRTNISGYRPSEELKLYKLRCESFKNLNYKVIIDTKSQCLEWLSKGYMLRIDTYHAFCADRVWTKDHRPKQLDANNRVKACLDAVATMIGIDDKYFFDGDCGKITCNSKESECTIIKITPMRPMTLDQLLMTIKQAS